MGHSLCQAIAYRICPWRAACRILLRQCGSRTHRGRAIGRHGPIPLCACPTCNSHALFGSTSDGLSPPPDRTPDTLVAMNAESRCERGSRRVASSRHVNRIRPPTRMQIWSLAIQCARRPACARRIRRTVHVPHLRRPRDSATVPDERLGRPRTFATVRAPSTATSCASPRCRWVQPPLRPLGAPARARTAPMRRPVECSQRMFRRARAPTCRRDATSDRASS